MSSIEGNSNNNKRVRASKNEPYTQKKFFCKQCPKYYLSYQALYAHKKQKHNYKPNKTIYTDGFTQTQTTLNDTLEKHDCYSFDQNYFLNNYLEIDINNTEFSGIKENLTMSILTSEIEFIFFDFKDKLKDIVKGNLLFSHHHAFYKHLELYLKDKEKYLNSDSSSFIIDKVLLLYIVECDRTDPQPDMNEVVFYTILLREFINKEKQKELNLHYLLEFTTFNYSNEIILSSNKFLTLIEKIDLIKIKMDRAILYFQKLSSWLFKNNYTEFKLI